MYRRPAYSLLELVFTLTITGIALGVAVPSGLHGIDVLSVRAARSVIVSMSSRARALGIARGNGELVLDEAGSVVEIRSNGAVFQRYDLLDRHRVALTLENSTRSRASLEYNAIGLGRLAGITVRVTRRSATGGVTFSTYGRPRLW